MLAFTLKLLLAHVIGDFVLQTDRAVVDKHNKKHKSVYLYLHMLSHAILLAVFLGFNLKYWWVLLIVLPSHFLIDLIKLNLSGSKIGARPLFFYDQAAHLIILIACILWQFPIEWSIDYFYEPKVLLLGLFLILTSFVSAIVMKFLMSKWAFVEDKKDDSLDNAGKYIGMLERLFVFGFIVFNQWQAIGLLIAAKSVLRYSDLSRAKDRKLTEYILIGTLTSFGFAILLGLAYKELSKFI